jgi:hypothetical protein
VKPQLVRLADVFFIGPLMIWGGLKIRGLGGYTLAGLGAATIWYNGRNYLRARNRPGFYPNGDIICGTNAAIEAAQASLDRPA